MIRLLERAAAAAPGRTAVISAEGTASYEDLLTEARGIAAGLQQRGIVRLAIVEPDAARVIALLAGAALAGAEACQYQPDTPASEFAEQATVLGHHVVVSRRTDLGDQFQVLTPEALLASMAQAPAQAPDEQPLLIRTTGTTGAPKAARHDWRMLARTVERLSPRPEQRWLLAYGPQQFAGIQVLLHVVASQATLVAPFPRQPRDGLQALVAHDVTCVSATPTYWRFLLAQARSLGAALPPLDQVTLGGEAIPGDLLEELGQTFPEARISQVYASTEFGSVTSVRDGRPGLALASLYDEHNPTATLRVVDGELWIRSGAGMSGYVGGDVSEQTDAMEGGEWRATGDLVEVVGDRVLFRGRTSEVINVGGVKVAPLPVEDRIMSVDGVALVRVFGRPNRLTGAIVAAEVVPEGGVEGADQEVLRAAIKAAVAELPRAWHPRSINFVDAFETRGEKTIRRMEQ